jgi:X breakpoint 2-interacting protein
MVIISDDNQARMTQLQDAQKGAEVTSEATDRELELEAQLVEARSIIQEQVCAFYILFIVSE